VPPLAAERECNPMKKTILAILLLMSFSPFAFAAVLYVNDFEGDALGDSPRGWERGFEGDGVGAVIVDPVDGGNKVFAHSDLAHDMARHDVGGNIWVVGDADWQDYVVDYDAYFPEDFYIGVLFRFVDSDNFYLLDRRLGDTPEAPTFDIWKHESGWVNLVAGAPFGAAPGVWYNFRVVVMGDTFTVFAKSKDVDVPFEAMDPLLTGVDSGFTSGKFGLYGLIYIDNVVIGDTVDDITTAVEPGGKLSITWGDIKK